jgi:hypothetical protein
MLRYRLPLLLLVVAVCSTAYSQPLPVRYAEGLVHGFLTLRSATGEVLADGELLQIPKGTIVKSRLVLHFHDGSLHDETSVFSQKGTFRLISDHLIQKGPSFPTSIDATIDVAKGQVDVRSRKEGKEESAKSDPMKLPVELSNGLLFILLKNVAPDAGQIASSMLAYTPKPRVVGLKVSAAGEETFSVGSGSAKAKHFVVHPELGGITGVIAPLVGKEPPDAHIWIMTGDVPAFIRFQGSLFAEGPIWTIELASPRWPSTAHPS